MAVVCQHCNKPIVDVVYTLTNGRYAFRHDDETVCESCYNVWLKTLTDKMGRTMTRKVYLYWGCNNVGEKSLLGAWMYQPSIKETYASKKGVTYHDCYLEVIEAIA